jgi:hypothetical protein
MAETLAWSGEGGGSPRGPPRPWRGDEVAQNSTTRSERGGAVDLAPWKLICLAATVRSISGSDGLDSGVPGSGKRGGLGSYRCKGRMHAKIQSGDGLERWHGLLLPCISNLGFLLFFSATEQGVGS